MSNCDKSDVGDVFQSVVELEINRVNWRTYYVIAFPLDWLQTKIMNFNASRNGM